MGYNPSTKKKKKRARRVEEVRLRWFAIQTIDSGWDDSGRYRGWKFFVVVWDGATVIIGSVSKMKHVTLCSFSSFQTPADLSNIHRKA